MDRIELLTLITDVPDRASDALEELKRLQRAGWIDVTCYALLAKDAQGAIRIQEASDSGQSITLAATAEAATVPAGWPCWLGQAYDAAPLSVGGNTGAVKDNLQSGYTALMVVLEERYLERVREEFETRGRTVRKHLRRGERVAALRAAVEHTRTNVNWLVQFLQTESAKASRVRGREKEELEATVAAGWAELGAERESLHDRLKALVAELDAELRETRAALDRSDGDRAELEARIGALESAIAAGTRDLVLFVLDHIESLTSHACELETKAAGSGAEAAKAIAEQLHELEVRMRRYRGEVTATLGSSAAWARRSLDRLRTEATAANSELRQPLEELMKNLDKRHAVVKADLRQLERESTRAWHERAAGLRKSWCALFEFFDGAKHQHP